MSPGLGFDCLPEELTKNESVSCQVMVKSLHFSTQTRSRLLRRRRKIFDGISLTRAGSSIDFGGHAKPWMRVIGQRYQKYPASAQAKAANHPSLHRGPLHLPFIRQTDGFP
jgi:hypothetical protein